MSELLPLSDYEWSDSDLFPDANSILNLPDESDIGYIFEVSLIYDESLHETHDMYPFCAEKRTLPQEALDILNQKPNKIKKLLLTLYDKEDYVIHYRMLKLALQHGLILKSVNRVLKFKQSRWLKSYIDLNTERRKEAISELDKELCKLLNNSVFGKTMENLRLHVILELVSEWEGKSGARSIIAKPNFKKCKIIADDLVIMEMGKTNILMNKPIIVGMSVLDLSKTVMYDFLYNYLIPKYNGKIETCYGDTDSFVVNVETRDIYEDIKADIHMYDTSNYPIPNAYNIERKNAKVLGCFKDELAGNVITEFIGLRAKCYAIRSFNGKTYNDNLKKAKGVKKNVLKRKISFDDYRRCVDQNFEFAVDQNSIRSIKHRVFSIQQKKVALSPFDDKRYAIKTKKNQWETLSWGNKRIKYYETMHSNKEEEQKKGKKKKYRKTKSIQVYVCTCVLYSV